MPTDTTFRSWRLATAQTMLNTGSFRIVLCNGGDLTEASTAAEIVSNEVVGNGYSRESVSFGAVEIDSSTGFAKIPTEINTIVSASGGDITYDAVVLWKNADSIGALEVSSINTSTNRLTVTGHGLSDGDKCAVTSTDLLPGGVISNTLYYIKSIDSNTVELYPDSGLSSIVDITSSGSGTIYLRLCNGEPARLYNVNSSTIGDGLSQTIQYTKWDFA